MVTSKLFGGLGNQMFQYALGRATAIRNDTDLVLDTSHYEQFAHLGRKYELGCFKLSPQVTVNGTPRFYDGQGVKQLVLKVTGASKRVTEHGFSYELTGLVGDGSGTVGKFDPNILKCGDNVYLVGFWNNQKYFIDYEAQIRKDFSFASGTSKQNSKLLNEINKTNSVSLHVRRGDYVNIEDVKETIGLLDLMYYTKAVEYMHSKLDSPHFYIFSDDPEWCLKHLKISASTVVNANTPDKGYEDMRLMSACKHNIIANSTFSWWSAWLNKNPDKVIIAPNSWFKDKSINTSDIVPNEWVRL